MFEGHFTKEWCLETEEEGPFFSFGEGRVQGEIVYLLQVGV